MPQCIHCEAQLRETQPPEGIVDGRQYFVCPDCSHHFVEAVDEAGKKYLARMD